MCRACLDRYGGAMVCAGLRGWPAAAYATSCPQTHAHSDERARHTTPTVQCPTRLTTATATTSARYKLDHPPPLQAAAQPSTKAAPTDRDSHTGRSTRTGGDFASSPAAPLFPIHRPPFPLVDLDAAPTTDTPLEAVCKWVDAIAGRRRTGGSLPSPSHSSAHARR